MLVMNVDTEHALRRYLAGTGTEHDIHLVRGFQRDLVKREVDRQHMNADSLAARSRKAPAAQ